ncbi:MAG TPA: helix-hairpin-helix domain-containing protein, partial [Vicinamibacterales bacterium]
MSVRNRLITACSVALCLGLAGYSGLAMAQKPKTATSTPTTSIHASNDGSPRAPQSGAARGAAKGGLLNLNTATVAELDALPSIGPKTAARIVEVRQKIGGFKKIEQLM